MLSSRREHPRIDGFGGCCFDNALTESFATLQAELLDKRSEPTRKMLANAIFDYIEAFNNPRRQQSSLGF